MALSATCVHEVRTTGLDDFNAVSAVVAVGGTLYTVGDVLTVSGGTSTTAATFTVATVTAGVVTSVTLTNAGHYTVQPANPVSTTGGTGTLCTLTVTWNLGGNGGIFDPGQVTNASNHAFTDLTTDTNTGNTATPIVSSVSYAFVAGDNGAWIYQSTSGGAQGWVAGWYNITAVSGGKATLNAAIGAVVLANYTLNTAVGISTNATPTGGIYAIDYSQQAGPQWNYTDLSSTGNGLTVSSAGHPFGRQQVGNSVCVMSGTTFTVGRYVIASVSGTTATVQGAANIHTGAGTNSDGAGALGGPYQSPGQAGAIGVTGNQLFIKNGTFTVTSASSNVAAGCLTWVGSGGAASTGRIVGYQTIRGDGGTKPIIKADTVITTFTLVSLGSSGYITNIEVDGNSRTSSRGIVAGGGTSMVHSCLTRNCTNSGIVSTGNSGITSFCEITGCSTQAALRSTQSFNCYVHDNTGVAISLDQGNSTCAFCIVVNSTGAGTTDGINSVGGLVTNCTVYGSGRDGIRYTGSGGNLRITNCLVTNATSSGGWAVNSSTANSNTVYVANLAWFNTASGGVNTANILFPASGNVTLGSDPFVNAPGGDFRLTPAAIALIGSQGIPGAMPGLPLSVGYLGIGAVQPLAQGIFVESNTAIIINPLSVVGYH